VDERHFVFIHSLFRFFELIELFMVRPVEFHPSQNDALDFSFEGFNLCGVR